MRDPRQLRRPRWCEIDGRRAWRFDLVLNLKYIAADRDSIANNYSAAVVCSPCRIEGRIALERRGLLRRPESAGLAEVAVPDATLGRTFRVRASSAELAAELLTADLATWLTGPGKDFHYEIVHDRVLAYGWRRYLGGNGPVRAALGLADRIARGTNRTRTISAANEAIPSAQGKPLSLRSSRAGCRP